MKKYCCHNLQTIQHFFLMLKGNYFVYVYMQHFASTSGLKINVDKIVAVCIGSERNSQVKFIPELDLNWNPGTFKVLDVMFSTD